MHTKTLFWRRFSSGVALAALLTVALPGGAQAANTNITGGTNGPSCNSGGYFTPGSVTVASGDTVTISVPLNDPYAGGIQVHGFPEGLFTVLPGHSHTTSALTANVSYYGTWPSTGCMKGSGTITVNAPLPSNPAPPSGSSGGSTTPAPTSGTSTPAPAANSDTTPVPTATQQTPAAQSNTATPTRPKSPKLTTSNSPAPSSGQAVGLGPVAAIGGGVVAVLALAAFLIWHFVLRRRTPKSGSPAAAATPPTTADVPPVAGTVQQTPGWSAPSDPNVNEGDHHEDQSST